MVKKRLFLLLLLIPFIFSCEEADKFGVAEPVTYYLGFGQELNLTPGPGGAWQYVTNYIYPDAGLNTNSWSVYLDKNIVKGKYGFSLLFWTATECQIRVEFILNDDGEETVLLSIDLPIKYIGDYNYTHIENDAKTAPVEGENPKGGKNSYLILRITHISGTDPVEILYDAATGTFGCTSITVFHDK